MESNLEEAIRAALAFDNTATAGIINALSKSKKPLSLVEDIEIDELWEIYYGNLCETFTERELCIYLDLMGAITRSYERGVREANSLMGEVIEDRVSTLAESLIVTLN